MPTGSRRDDQLSGRRYGQVASDDDDDDDYSIQ
jgi:hypothetical protein